MGALDGFHVEIEGAGCSIGANRGIARVGKGAGLAVAEAGDVVFVAAKILLFGGSMENTMSGPLCGMDMGKAYFSLKEQNC